ncbi:hypothetical protein BRC64_03890 [Halobacteriales archaeon QH_10_67_22]|nr:MAG: hypothetical protein BRC64_03890 [Halobacteriales archaeon QH_10_67_22]
MSAILGQVIDDLAATHRSLLVVNDDGDDGRLAAVLDYFEVVEPERVTAPGLPASTLVVTDGQQCLSAASVDDVHDYLFGYWDAERGTDDIPSDLATRVQGFLTALDGRVCTVEEAGKVPMVRISRHIEQRAHTRGSGSIHAGFQRLSRLDNERHTLDAYRRLAAAGVETHLYGVDDGRPPTVDGMTVHADPDGSVVGDYWFVVDDGDGDPAAGGALLTREVDSGVFEGFWTFQAEHVADILDRLESGVRPQLDAV